METADSVKKEVPLRNIRDNIMSWCVFNPAKDTLYFTPTIVLRAVVRYLVGSDTWDKVVEVMLPDEYILDGSCDVLFNEDDLRLATVVREMDCGTLKHAVVEYLTHKIMDLEREYLENVVEKTLKRYVVCLGAVKKYLQYDTNDIDVVAEWYLRDIHKSVCYDRRKYAKTRKRVDKCRRG